MSKRLADMDENERDLRKARNARYSQKVRDAQNLPYFHKTAEASRIALSDPWSASCCDKGWIDHE